MKVILQQDVKGQGKKGQLLDVSEGYGRNYLIPRKLAIAATTGNMAALNREERDKQKKLESEKAAALETAEKLKGLIVKIPARSGGARADGTGGKLFGAVTTREISEALMEQHGILIEKHKIAQEEHIKTFGSYEVKCKIGFEVSGAINVLVIEAP